MVETKEEWRDVPIEGFGHLYAVSNLGRVKSYDRIVKKKLGSYAFQEARLLKHSIAGKGYYRVRLKINGKTIPCSIHRLVALAFIPNPDNKPQVNHINGDKTDNSVENLEWMTNSENQLHSYQNGLTPNKGEGHNKSKLTEPNVRYILINPLGLTQRRLADVFDVHYSTLNDIIKRKSWKHISI